MFIGDDCGCGDHGCSIVAMERNEKGMILIGECGLEVIIPDSTRFYSVEQRNMEALLECIEWNALEEESGGKL